MKKLMSLLLVLCLVVAMVPMAASAEENPVAEVNGQQYTDLATAVANAKNGTTITLLNDVTLTAPINLESGSKVVIEGDNKTISYDGSDKAVKVPFTWKDSDNQEGIPSNVTLKVSNVKFENTASNASESPAGYAVLVGHDALNTTVTLSNCTFTNLYTAVLVNQQTKIPSVGESYPSFSITGCNYSNTTYGYSVDEVTVGTAIHAVGVNYQNNPSSPTTVKEPFNKVTISENGIVKEAYSSVKEAMEKAESGDTVTLHSNMTVDGTGIQSNQGAITVTNDITLDGNGYTITGQGFASDPAASLINIEQGADVVVKDLTLNSNAKHGLNIYSDPTVTDNENKTTVTLSNVSVSNGKGYGVVCNNSIVNATNLKTSDNGWGGVNVDKGAQVTIDGSETSLAESGSIVYENSTSDTEQNGSLTVNNGTYQNIVVQAQEETDKICGSVSITGGQFGGIIAMGAGAEKGIDAPALITIMGGQFSKTESGEVGGDNNGNYVAIKDLVEEDYELNADGTVVEEKPSTPVNPGPTTPTYTVTAPVTENGEVTVSPTTAKQGDTVTVTATPDKGYKVGTVSVKEKDGTAVAVAQKDGKYTFTQPDSEVTVTVTFVWDNPFTDVGDAWYTDAVEYVYLNNLMAGMSETTFEPETKLTRAQAVQILYNLEGKPQVTETSEFTDLVSGEWYVDAISWAAKNGIAAGYGDGTFGPSVEISREQFAQMLYNYASYKDLDLTKTGNLSQFPDADSISSWATTAMSWANGNGLINGFEEDDTIRPAGTAIRAQAASILMNFDKNLVK